MDYSLKRVTNIYVGNSMIWGGRGHIHQYSGSTPDSVLREPYVILGIKMGSAV